MSTVTSNHKQHSRSGSQKGEPVAHSTPAKGQTTKSIRFSCQTPDVKNGIDLIDGSCSPPSTRFVFKRDLSSQLSPSKNASDLSEMDRDTIVKQRTELQLLIGELKDRDKELNEMVHAHHQQMKSWDEDRQKLVNLEQKCSKSERDLSKRNHQVRELLKKLKSVESDALATSKALNETQSQLSAAISEHSMKCQQIKELEAYNIKLQDSLKGASCSLGEMEGKVSQLSKQLQCKEREALETSKEMTDLASRLQSLEHSYKQLEKITFEVKSSANDWKNKYTDLKHVTENLKGEVDISNATIDEKDEEIERLRDELKDKISELSYTAEREKRKDQLLALQKSKQERIDKELSSLRQMYDLQQHKLASARKELTDMKEHDLKYRANISHIDDSLGADGITFSSPNKSDSQLDASREIHVSLKPRSPTRRSATRSELVTLELSGRSSTERLQRLLDDSKRLVDNMANADSRSPTNAISQLSLSAESGKS